MTTSGRRLRQLPKDEAMRLLRGASMGRIVFTSGGLPSVRPVNHVVDDGAVVIRTHLGSATLDTTGSVVAYEADAIDPDEHTGWSVIVTGLARIVEDSEEIRRYEALLQPWVSQQLTHVIRVDAEVVTGFELLKD